MKSKTNPITTPISKKARVQTTDTGRDFIDLDGYVYGADLENLSIKDYKRVLRGGCWYVNAWDTRVSDRLGGVASYRNNFRGFRFVLQRKT